MNQKVKISSFINDFEEPNPVYLNREKISKPLDIQANDYTPIQNDWQDTSIIPELANGLDIILKNPGIYPTESVNRLNKGRLKNFFTKLP